MRLGWIVPLAVIALLATTRVAVQVPDATGAFAGCITDPTGQPLSGVTVDMSTNGGVHRTIVSDRAGCYEIVDLPQASYVVFATLAGVHVEAG